MPQMAPMMWQTIYLSVIILLMLSMAKNFFTKIGGSQFTENACKLTYEKSWKW